MKEIIDLQARVIAHAPSLADGTGLDFSRAETGGDFTLLSPELRAEIDELQRALNAAIPEDFEYYVFIGGDEGPFFGLEFERIPAGPEGDWNPEEPILDQLGPFNWEAARAGAKSGGETMRNMIELLDRLKLKPQPAKGLQRVYRQEVKDFVRERRRDAGKVHVLFRNQKEELLEVAFEDGEAFREMLPGMVSRGEDVFGVVAYGKPLPVERIDALNTQAHRTFQERMREGAAKTASQPEEEHAADDAPTEKGENPPD